MRKIIVSVDRFLCKEERKNFAKEKPGYRLCFRLRYPNFPMYISAFATAVSIAALVIAIAIRC